MSDYMNLTISGAATQICPLILVFRFIKLNDIYHKFLPVSVDARQCRHYYLFLHQMYWSLEIVPVPISNIKILKSLLSGGEERIFFLNLSDRYRYHWQGKNRRV